MVVTMIMKFLVMFGLRFQRINELANWINLLWILELYSGTILLGIVR